jgi:ribonuclease Y
MQQEEFAYFLLSGFIGVAFGVAILWTYYRFKVGGLKSIAKEILRRAEYEADNLKRTSELTAKQQLLELQRDQENTWQNERRKIQREEERLKQREDKLEGRLALVEKKLSDIEKREALIAARTIRLDEEEAKVAATQIQLQEQLERTSGLSSSEARALLIEKVTNDAKTDAANLVRKIQKEAEEEAEQTASRIIATAINRLATPCVSEATVTTVAIPNDEMKGRIIGREGRNIRALERATGVNFIIDDTPGAVVMSGFDPVRLNVAKLALSELIQDGRIHPTRIEEAVEKAVVNTQKQIKQFGEDAALRAGAMNLHPELVHLLGKLKFRYSYGQNVLDHSLEVSYLMGIMASELGLDVKLAKRIGLLHDIGKAVSHEVEGAHAIIGHDLSLKYGEAKEVANGIGCHHEEMEAKTIEGSLCSAADKISASRQGARIEAVEEYVKRLKHLEDLAFEFPGVEKAYAMQAGREIRIVVLPDMIDDNGILNLARDVTKRIEKELNYPGKIKVTVIREKRAVEYAV